MKNKKIVETGAIITIVIIIAKITGFIKQILTASVFGTSAETDVVSLSETFISNIDFLLTQSFVTAFIPVYIKIKKMHKYGAYGFASNTIKKFLFLSFSISILLLLSSGLIAIVLAPGYDLDRRRNLSMYLKMFSPGIILIVMTSIFNALLRANEKFILSEMFGIFQNIILILIIILLNKVIGIKTLMVGFYVYAFVNLIIAMTVTRKEWSYRFVGEIVLDYKYNDCESEMSRAMIPLIIGYSAVFINQQVDKILLSKLESGTITAIGYSSVLINFVATFITAFCTMLFTHITTAIANKKEKDAATLSLESSVLLITLFLPISLIVFFCSKDIVTIVFGHGAFDDRSIKISSIALKGYSLLIVPFILREMYSKVIYAYGKTIYPTINSIISIIINIVLSIILVKRFEVLGVTIATSISVFVNAILNMVFAKTICPHIKYSRFSIWVFIWGVALLTCFFINNKLNDLFSNINIIIKFGLCSFISMLCYLFVSSPFIYIMRKKKL